MSAGIIFSPGRLGRERKCKANSRDNALSLNNCFLFCFKYWTTVLPRDSDKVMNVEASDLRPYAKPYGLNFAQQIVKNI